MVANVGNVQNELSRERPLNREVPGFHIGIFEVLVDLKEVGVFEHHRRRGAAGTGDYAIQGNHGLDDGGKTLLESCRSYAVSQHRGAKAGDCGIEGIVRANREIVGVTIVRERRKADAEPRADNG